jgi:hypothetical protein
MKHTRKSLRKKEKEQKTGTLLWQTEDGINIIVDTRTEKPVELTENELKFICSYLLLYKEGTK